MPADVNSVVKTYDVRGLVDSELTDDIVEALAAAFVDVIGANDTSIVVGHDMRDSSPRFVEAFTRGASARGADIISIGCVPQMKRTSPLARGTCRPQCLPLRTIRRPITGSSCRERGHSR